MTRARDLARIANSNALTIDSSGNVGIGSTVPTSKLSVVGVVSATSFFGSGVNLTGISSVSFATTSFGLSGTPNITVGTIAATSLNASGVATATTFVGALTGNATGLSGSPNITVGNITGTAATFTNLTVNGTQTIINTTSLEISDKNIGIGSTSTPSDSYADGAGITIYGTTNKTLTWDNSNSRLAFSTNIYAPKYYGDGSTLTNVSAGLALQQSYQIQSKRLDSLSQRRKSH